MLRYVSDFLAIAIFGVIGYFLNSYPIAEASSKLFKPWKLVHTQEFEPVTHEFLVGRVRIARALVVAMSTAILCSLWLIYPINWLVGCILCPTVFGITHYLQAKYDNLDRYKLAAEVLAAEAMMYHFNQRAQEVVPRFPSSEFVSEDRFIRELVQFSRSTEIALKSIIDVTFIDVGYISKVTIQEEGDTITTYAIGGNTPYLIIRNLTPNNRAEALVVYIDELENWMRDSSLGNGNSFGMPRLVPQNDWSEIPYTHENRYVFNTRREYIRFSVLNKMSHECALDSIKTLMTKNAIEPRADYLDIPPKLLNLDVH